MTKSGERQPSEGGLERRKFIRVNTRLTAIFKNLKTGKVRRALTKDVSGLGLCLVTEEILEPGTLLGVEIKLPDREAPITFTAEVVWSRPIMLSRKSYENPTGETGIRFLGIDPKDQKLLRAYATINAPPGNA